MAKKAKEPETIMVRMANAGQTSAGNHEPDDARELPADEARELIRAGLAVRTGTVQAARMHRPDITGNYRRLRRGAVPGSEGSATGNG